MVASNETQDNEILAGQVYLNSEWGLNTQENHEKQF